MRNFVLAALAIGLTANPAMAQAPTAATTATATGKLSAATTPVNQILKNPPAKAALERVFPEIAQYYEQIGSSSLTEIAPMSGGNITDEKIKALQAEFDKLK